MKRLAIAVFTGITFFTAAAVAQEEREQSSAAQTSIEVNRQSAEEANAKEQAAQDEEVVCKTEKVTGSLVRRRRTCMTRAEWDERDRRIQQGLRDFNRGASGGVECTTDQFGGC